MSNHTKGKWEVFGESGCLNQTLISIRKSDAINQGRDPIGVAYGDPESDETKANAALFASAPDLLAERDALRAVLREILTIDDGTSVVHLPSALRERAEKLLAGG